MKASAKNLRSTKVSERSYLNFDQLDGRHPWGQRVPEGMIQYQVRKLAGGKVSYFNFDLALEMGLISKDHPRELNKTLCEKILETFCLRIINEYDQQHGLRVPSSYIKPHKYMATRYLQMQHSDKTGRTSGDGRCIWNGQVVARGKIWDVSSRGTGVTALAPGAVQAGQPLKSGNNEHGYGCGMAEIDELYGAAILAEIFHRNEIPTERVLAIVDLGKGVGIGVRAAPNLLRPAHMFMFLKQGRLEPLRRSLDYFIDRQHSNKVWNFDSRDKDRYTKMLQKISHSFARFAATLERDYIFAWLDWDGDNVLADAGIIDYGSVRQFGLRHDQYRYDDVERWSTNLTEQRLKARQMLQTFAQLIDFAQTGARKKLQKFEQSSILKEFDQEFHRQTLERFLYQIGLPQPLSRLLMNKHLSEVEALFEVHSKLERIKTSRKIQKVPDGIHRPAILNMRLGLAKMADYLDGLPLEMIPLVDADEFFMWVISSQASHKDRRRPAPAIKRLFALWQQRYLKLLRKVTTVATWEKSTALINKRSKKINHEARITGNALIHIVDEILRYRRRGLSDREIQAAIEDLIDTQTLNPDFKKPGADNPKSHPIVRTLLTVVHGYREDI